MIYLELLFIFFKIGLFTIGGGYAMIPMIKSEVIDRGFITTNEFSDFMAISESTPGPFAVNIATFIGYNEAGFFGAFCATLGVILPSFIIIIIIAKIVDKFLNNKYIRYALDGVRPVVVGLILSVATSLMYSCLIINNNVISFSISAFIIMAITFILSRFKRINKPVLLILISAALGIIFFKFIGLS